MKKLGLSLAVAAALGAGAAGAYTVGTVDDGVLIPNVIHGNGEGTTAIGVINHSTADVTVYWTFFDQDSNHVTDGQFDLTGNDFYGFVWSQEAGVGLENMRGYLVFFGDQDGDMNLRTGQQAQISATAFQANAATQDAVYIPTFPIDWTDLATTVADPTVLDADSLAGLRAGAPTGSVLDLRYDFSNNNDWSSRIVLWATDGLNKTTTVNMYNDDQARKSVNFTCGTKESELCFVDPLTIVGRPADFERGFVRYQYVGETVTSAAVSYTTVTSKSFGSTQTLLNTHFLP